MKNYTVEKDRALRGYWVKELGDINKWVRDSLACWDGKEVFIPDSLLRFFENRKNNEERKS